MMLTIHSILDMLPFSTCYPGFSFSSAPSSSVLPQIDPHNPPISTTERHLNIDSRFANKTYGEVLQMYQTSFKKKSNLSNELLLRCSELLSDSPKSASHHYKEDSLISPIDNNQSTASVGNKKSVNQSECNRELFLGLYLCF